MAGVVRDVLRWREHFEADGVSGALMGTLALPAFRSLTDVATPALQALLQGADRQASV